MNTLKENISSVPIGIDASNELITLLYVDLFCGAGGTSTGVESAKVRDMKCAKVIACVNHDKNAIASHASNHPESKHFTEDMRTLDLTELMLHVEAMRSEYPNAKVVLWASLECTNHSRAKGGMSRDADSRTLANHLVRYILEINPDFIHIENVSEFLDWGPLIVKTVKNKSGYDYCPLEFKKGNKKRKPEFKPIWVPDPKSKGEFYSEWVKDVRNLGYDYEYKILNSADFGAYTSRKRLFIQFPKHGLPIVWPEPTHCKSPVDGSTLKPWKAVREKLDLNNHGISIFSRQKALVENTLARIYAGLIKFVAKGHDCFLQQRNSGNPNSKVTSIDSASRVITCTGGNLEKVNVSFLSKYHGSKNGKHNRNYSIDDPCSTVDTSNRFAFINTTFLSTYYGNGSVISINDPCPTVTTKDRIQIIIPFFVNNYTNGGIISSVEGPSPTLTQNPKQNVCVVRFIDQQFGKSKPASIDGPVNSIQTNPKFNYVSCEPWVMDTSFNNVGGSIDSPLGVVTANRKQHYLLNPQYASDGGDINNPCFTLIARMDKSPPYLVSTEDGDMGILIYDTDSPMTVKIKQFMALYGISDIKMRLLEIPELNGIMGFPDGYVLVGTKAEQKKYIGNAVEVHTARALCEGLGERLLLMKTA